MTIPEQAVALLPCPFCGTQPHTYRSLGQICCVFEDCMGPHTTAGNLKDATVQWNKRAASLVGVQRPEDVARALESIRQYRDAWREAIDQVDSENSQREGWDGSDRNLAAFDQAMDAVLALPPLRAREEIAWEASEIAVVGSRHALDPQDATTSVDGMDIIEMLQDPALTNCTNTELFSYAVDEITGLRERLRDVLSRTAGQEWRDISSAPKDGTRILGWHPNWETSHTAQWYGRYWGVFYKTGPLLFQPTRWMPLPAPPVAEPKETP